MTARRSIVTAGVVTATLLAAHAASAYTLRPVDDKSIAILGDSPVQRFETYAYWMPGPWSPTHSLVFTPTPSGKRIIKVLDVRWSGMFHENKGVWKVDWTFRRDAKGRYTGTVDFEITFAPRVAGNYPLTLTFQAESGEIETFVIESLAHPGCEEEKDYWQCPELELEPKSSTGDSGYLLPVEPDTPAAPASWLALLFAVW